MVYEYNMETVGRKMFNVEFNYVVLKPADLREPVMKGFLYLE